MRRRKDAVRARLPAIEAPPKRPPREAADRVPPPCHRRARRKPAPAKAKRMPARVPGPAPRPERRAAHRTPLPARPAPAGRRVGKPWREPSSKSSCLRGMVECPSGGPPLARRLGSVRPIVPPSIRESGFFPTLGHGRDRKDWPEDGESPPVGRRRSKRHRKRLQSPPVSFLRRTFSDGRSQRKPSRKLLSDGPTSRLPFDSPGLVRSHRSPEAGRSGEAWLAGPRLAVDRPPQCRLRPVSARMRTVPPRLLSGDLVCLGKARSVAGTPQDRPCSERPGSLGGDRSRLCSGVGPGGELW